MSDGIVFVGLPGSGKTEVGRRVAERLGRPFIDIDHEIERISRRTAADLLSANGEFEMRSVEREAVECAVATRGAVIATGGGTVLDPLNRWRLMEHGIRIRLDAHIEQLAARLGSDPIARPLVGTDLESGLRRTADERAAMYAAADVALDATADPDAVAHAAIAAIEGAAMDGWRTLFDGKFQRHHPVGAADGRVRMGRHITAAALHDTLAAVGGRPAFVIDRAARDCHATLVAIAAADRSLVLEGGEHAKTFDQLQVVLAWMAEQDVERGDPLVVIGGGTIGDLGGLAAALHRRGVALVNVPTTWLAQADSAIGGKVAVDLPTAKNGVGTFWPASLVVADADLPATQPVERRRDGIAECIKCALIGDAQLWELAERRGPAALDGHDPAAAYALTERAVRLKLAIVERDPFETGERRKLNLGHTIGHALEIESGYTLAHGEAVALGLRAVAHIANGRGAETDLAERIDSILAALGFSLTRGFDRAAVVAAIGGDKKRERGVQRWILPMAVGETVEVSDVTEVELDAALDMISA